MVCGPISAELLEFGLGWRFDELGSLGLDVDVPRVLRCVMDGWMDGWGRVVFLR